MFFPAMILVNLSTFILPAFTLLSTSPIPSRLNNTTVGAANGRSTLECWQLSAPFVQSGQAGTAEAVFAQMGETGATSYLLLPPQFNGGFPVVQWVSFLSGLAVVSLPNSTETLTIHGGRNGLILATDISNVSTLGHRTVYPSEKVTVGIQIPTKDNEIPVHKVLHAGQCKGPEMDQ